MTLRGFIHRYWVGFVLSAVWLVGAAAVLDRQRAVEVGRLARQCHQMQNDARSNKLCAEASSDLDQPLCRFKDADCDRWPLEEERYVKNIAVLAVAPVAAAWVIFYGFVRIFRRSNRL